MLHGLSSLLQAYMSWYPVHVARVNTLLKKQTGLHLERLFGCKKHSFISYTEADKKHERKVSHKQTMYV